jgi:hypothetical protein
VFSGVMGGPLRRGNFNRMSAWAYAVRSIGAEGLHFHDLRHMGNTLQHPAGRACEILWRGWVTTASARHDLPARGPGRRSGDHPGYRHPRPGRAVNDDDDGSTGVLAPVG